MQLDPTGQKKGRRLDTHGIRFSIFMVAIIALISGGAYLATTHATSIKKFVTQPKLLTATALNTQDKSTTTKQTQTKTKPAATKQNNNVSLPESERAIVVSLSDQQVQLVNSGSITHSFPIMRDVRDTNKCEVTMDSFSVREKNSHFTPGANYYLPSTLHIQEKLFIHGRAHTNADTNKTIHCIQLNRTDAATLFDSVTPGTKVIIREDPVQISASNIPRVEQISHLSTPSYLVANLSTNTLIAGHNYQWQRPIASLTKLMTAVVAKKTLPEESKIQITKSAISTEGQRGKLQAGRTHSLSRLLYPLLLSSSNDAAAAIAEHVGRQTFIEQMNETAKHIGMQNTHFTDPAGLHDSNSATPLDLLKLTRYIGTHYPEILRITANTQKTLPRNDSIAFDNYTNTHPLAEEDRFIGGKNGWLPTAGHTQITLFENNVTKNADTIAVIALDSKKDGSDTQALLRWYQSQNHKGIAQSNIR